MDGTLAQRTLTWGERASRIARPTGLGANRAGAGESPALLFSHRGRAHFVGGFRCGGDVGFGRRHTQLPPEEAEFVSVILDDLGHGATFGMSSLGVVMEQDR